MSGAAPWPAIEDVAVSLTRAAFAFVDVREFGVYTRLVWFLAVQSVNTYSDAVANPSLPDDDEDLARLAMCSANQWAKVKPIVLSHFDLRNGRWYLKDDTVIRIMRASSRNPIPMAVKSAVMARDGQRCAYCGDTEGPFHFDHLFPVAKGGTDAPNNIVIACQPCNLSKRDRTILEWVEFLRGRE